MSYFFTHKMTLEECELLKDFSRRPWSAKFHKTVPNPSAPGGAVDMFILFDDDSGEQMVSIAVPAGRGVLANWIAACCARPWFVEHTHDGKALTDMAIAFNRVLEDFRDDSGDLDARDVAIAAITILSGYVRDLPKYARDELTNRLLVALNEMMRIGE